MIVPGGNHLDRQLRLSPAAYVTEGVFGRDTAAQFAVPEGGDQRSLVVAHIQHRVIVAWRAASPRSASAFARRWGVSKQTVSRTLLGDRWAGQLVLAALMCDR